MTEFFPQVPRNPEQELYNAVARALPLGYIMGHEIGHGGNGTVYHADHYRYQQETLEAAVKVLNAPGDRQAQRRFSEEATFLEGLNHPNIIGVQHVGSVDYHHPKYQNPDAVPFFIMDRAHGSLADIMRDDPKLSAHTAAGYAMQAMEGLAYVHNDQGDPERKKHVHLDVKPGNLLYLKDKTGEVTIKVADFGITRLSDTQSGNEETASDAIPGTWQYMAPEHFEGTIQRACDIYAMGVVTYQMLARKLPILGADSAVSWYNAHRDQQPPAIDTRQRPQAEARLIDRLQLPVAKALQKRAGDRFDTMTEFKETVREAVAKAAEADRKARTFITDRSPTQSGKPGTKEYTNGPFAPSPPQGETRHYTGSPNTITPATPQRPQTVVRPRFEPPAVRQPPRPMSPTVQKPHAEFKPEPKEPSKLPRRVFLSLLGVSGLAAAGYVVQDNYNNWFGTPDPTEKASPAQAGVDYIAKNIMDALVNGEQGDKDQAGLILRELVHLNPAWTVQKAPGMALTYDYELAYQRRLFQEYPDGAYSELDRMKRERYDWRAEQLMGMFVAGYTPIGKKGDNGQEDRRILAHQKYNNAMGTQLGIMLDALKAANNPTGGLNYDDERRILCSIYYNGRPFNIDTVLGDTPKGPTENVDTVVSSLITKENLSGIELIGAALAPKNPALAKRILDTLVERALKVGDTQSWKFVETISDAMAQYPESRAAVITQMNQLSTDKKKDAATIQTATNMAVSVGPFDAQATADFVENNADQPNAHLAMLAVGDKGTKLIQAFRNRTSGSNMPWFDIAIDPTNRDAADAAIDTLKGNSLMLRESGNVIGAALVAGRRFSDAS